MGADLLGDQVIEEELRALPKKFTIHCFFFLMIFLISGAFCRWISIKI